MSAFAMVLAAGMAVGSGPEAGSAEAERGRSTSALTHRTETKRRSTSALTHRTSPVPWRSFGREGTGCICVLAP